jgi:hypothetical protein
MGGHVDELEQIVETHSEVREQLLAGRRRWRLFIPEQPVDVEPIHAGTAGDIVDRLVPARHELAEAVGPNSDLRSGGHFVIVWQGNRQYEVAILATFTEGGGVLARGALHDHTLNAPHPVMREIALLATAKDFTQDSLAKACGGGVRGGNVARHFEAKRPRESTVRRYATLLEVSPEYLLLLLSGKFEHPQAPEHRDSDAKSQRGWLDMLAAEFDTDEWERGTNDAVRECIGALPEGERKAYLREFALAWYRERYREGDAYPGYAARAVFEASAPAHLKLAERKRARAPGAMRFVNLWGEFGEDFDPGDFDVLLAVVRALHKKRGIDTAPMDDELNDDMLYRRWRGSEQPTIDEPADTVTEASAPAPRAPLSPETRRMRK